MLGSNAFNKISGGGNVRSAKATAASQSGMYACMYVCTYELYVWMHVIASKLTNDTNYAIATRAGRVVRLVRMVRLVRLVKLYKYSSMLTGKVSTTYIRTYIHTYFKYSRQDDQDMHTYHSLCDKYVLNMNSMD